MWLCVGTRPAGHVQAGREPCSPRLVALPVQNRPPAVPVELDQGGIYDALRPLLSLEDEALQGLVCGGVVSLKARFELGHDSTLVGSSGVSTPSLPDTIGTIGAEWVSASQPSKGDRQHPN